MGEFFGSIYCVFEDFFGLELAEYLWGQASPESTTNSFIGIGFWMLGISLGMTIIYYYVVDYPKFGNWWGWGIFLLGNAFINFIVGWQIVLRDYHEGLMVTINPSTNMKEPLNIGVSEILCFGVSNMILSIAVFFIFSLIVKWWSTNCPHAPF